MQANVESQTMLSADMELIETKNKVKQLEQEIAFLNSDLQEKLQFISNSANLYIVSLVFLRFKKLC
jgi:hypothetical protein